ncbi:MAG: hypothetical protein HY013_21485 [Candidatus Solibacter usitatus]|nr:hypothetical protein [Candidatus Solibacter usitatus]
MAKAGRAAATTGKAAAHQAEKAAGQALGGAERLVQRAQQYPAGSAQKARLLQSALRHGQGAAAPLASPNKTLKNIADSILATPHDTPTSAFEAFLNMVDNVSKGSVNALVPRYGNFGGPGWTGGADTFVSGTHGGDKKPINRQDEVYQRHDQAYVLARQNPDPAARTRMIEAADRALIADLQKIPFGASGTPYGEVFRAMAIPVFEAKAAFEHVKGDALEVKKSVSEFARALSGAGTAAQDAWGGLKSLFAT